MILVLIIASLCWSGCNKVEPTNIALNLKSKALVEANNTFGFQFFEQLLANEADDKNLMVSPLSVSQALSMALNGAKDNTFMEMNSVLGYEGLPLSDVNENNLELYNALIKHDPKVEMNISNAIWNRNDFTLKPDFIKNNQTYFNAEVGNFDPQQPKKAIDTMNKWVKENTKGKIEKIVNEINDEDVLFLINAIYFKAEWKTKFKQSDTLPQEFTLDNGTKKQVETMIGEAELTYKNETKYSAIKLPYGSGKFNMIIYLPEEGYTTSDLIPELVNTDFETLNSMTPVKMDLWLPKFEFEYENELINEMQSLGMHDAFEPYAANFSGISDLQIYISSITHKTYIKTDEEGSEAAAATKITFGLTSVGPGEVVRINRSFLFAIVEEDTNSILFIGKVYDPSIS
ncbi:MAG: serpin family protein [Prolixibacteraceae bacterium]|nr:serpin family protein [Prolixibacteraceae bacterium]